MDQVIADLQAIVAADIGGITFFGVSWYMVSQFVWDLLGLANPNIPFVPFF